MNKTNNNLYIESLVDFILDTKPYHSKLTEVIQELRFSDKINVKIKDNDFLTAKLSSIWSKIHYSDGWRTRFLLPPTFTPRYSSETNLFKFNINTDSVEYLKTDFNINNCFQFGSSQGIESTYLDNSILIEGIDYWSSKGFYSFDTKITNTQSEIKLTTPTSEWTKSNPIYNHYSGNPYIDLSNIEIIPNKESWWEIQVVKKINYFEQKIRGKNTIAFSKQSIINQIDNYDVNFHETSFVEIFYRNKISDPKNINISENNISIDFDTQKTYVIRIINGGNYKFEFSNTDSAIITHNLNSTDFIHQIYFYDEITDSYNLNPNVELYSKSTDYIQLVQILDENTISIKFNQPYSGYIVLRPSLSVEFIDQKGIEIFNNYTNFKIYKNAIEISPEQFTYKLKKNGNVYIKFNGNTTGKITFGYSNIDGAYTVTNKFTNEIVSSNNFYYLNSANEKINIAFDKIPFKSSEVNFLTNFKASVDIGEKTILRPENKIAVKPGSTEQVWSIIKINPVPFKIFNSNNNIDIVGFNPSRKYVKLIPHACHFIATEASLWKFNFTQALEFEIKKYLPKKDANNNFCYDADGDVLFNPTPEEISFKNIKLGPWYENAEIKIKIVHPTIAFDPSKAYNEEYLTWYTTQCIADNVVQIGDTFYFEILDKKPNYLVYGSENKQFQFATIGEYFWNGEIGFMPAAPHYSINGTYFLNPLDYDRSYGYYHYDNDLLPISQFSKNSFDDSAYDSDFATFGEYKNLVHSNKYWFLEDSYPLKWNIKEGTLFLPKIDEEEPVTLGIEFYRPPRFDAHDERFDISINANYVTPDPEASLPQYQFNVNSSIAGKLPSAIFNQLYSNFETNSLSSTYGNAGALNFKLFSDWSELDEDTYFTVEIISNFIKPFHSKDVLILKNQNDQAGKLVVNTLNFDKLQFNIFNKPINDTLGNYFDDISLIPTYVKLSKLNPYFLDKDITKFNGSFDAFEFENSFYDYQFDSQPANFNRIDTYDLLLSNSPTEKVGTISSIFDPAAGFNRQVIDVESKFLKTHLPLNTSMKFTSIQTDEYNHQVGTLITETIKWSDRVKFSDKININVIDSKSYEGAYDAFINMYDCEWASYDEIIKYNSILNLARKDVIIFDGSYDLFDFDSSIYDLINLEDVSKIKLRNPFILSQKDNETITLKITDAIPVASEVEEKADQESTASISENSFLITSRFVSSDQINPNLGTFGNPIYYDSTGYEHFSEGLDLYFKMFSEKLSIFDSIYSATIELDSAFNTLMVKDFNGNILNAYNSNYIPKEAVKAVMLGPLVHSTIPLENGDKILFPYLTVDPNIYIYQNGNFFINPTQLSNNDLITSEEDYSQWVLIDGSWQKIDYHIKEINPKVFELLFFGTSQAITFVAN